MDNSADTSLATLASFIRKVQWVVVLLAIGWLLSKLSSILTPFVVAAMLGWLGDPVVDKLEARGASRNTAVITVFAVMCVILLAVVLVLVPVIVRQVGTLAESWPQYQAWLSNWFTNTLAPWVQSKFNIDLVAWFDSKHLMDMLHEHWQRVGGIAATVLGSLSRSGVGMVMWLVNLVLIPILAFFFLRDWDKFVERVASLIPRDSLATVTKLAKDSNDVLSGFLRGQFLVMIADAIMYGVGLSLFGIKVGILIGFIGGLLSFVPYLGPTSVVVMGTIAALVQGLGWQGVAGVLVVWGVAQLIESYILTPKLVGDRIGLHPMVVIFAVMAGGALFGFVGMLLALPGAAVLNVLLRYCVDRYQHSKTYIGHQGGGDVSTPATLAPQASDAPAASPPEA